LCHLQHKLIGFYNRDEKCLQRGTDWVFKQSGLRFVFKGLINHYHKRFERRKCILKFIHSLKTTVILVFWPNNNFLSYPSRTHNL
jgi:hypothetical protein